MYVQCYAIAIDQCHRNNSMYNNYIQCITFALLHWLGLRVRDRFRFRVTVRVRDYRNSVHAIEQQLGCGQRTSLGYL